MFFLSCSSNLAGERLYALAAIHCSSQASSENVLPIKWRRSVTRRIHLDDHSSQPLATAALDTLHGARSLPPDEAVAKLRDFLESINTTVPDSPRLAEASDALMILVSQLEREGSATDDEWQHAIGTMLSLANETS
jgi:hypothetical protein